MQELTQSLPGLVALGAAALALVGLVLALVLAVKLRRLRRAQVAVLGGAEQGDLVSHAARLEAGFTDLSDMVDHSLAGAESRLVELERRLEGCVAHSALVRYDAYGEMSGQQSSTLALLDARRSGVVLSSILHRDAARVYVKRVEDGRSEIDLSPEEEEAIGAALAGDSPAPLAAAGNGRT